MQKSGTTGNTIVKHLKNKKSKTNDIRSVIIVLMSLDVVTREILSKRSVGGGSVIDSFSVKQNQTVKDTNLYN